ncbi:MAG: agmatinase [Bacteriovoracaceae bacterium]|nr:agmatinase [Bacteriovoracaceae bacterium]
MTICRKSFMDLNPSLKKPETGPYDFFEFADKIQPNSTHIIGFEFDGTACFRKGTRLGPDAIRKDSTGIESYSPYLDFDLEEIESDLIDLGNLPVGISEDQEKNWQQATDFFFDLTNGHNLKEENIKIVTLGGEHSISYAPIKKYLEDFQDLVLIHLDAHADLRDGYEGYHYSHASIIKRTLDHMTNKHKLIQYGIRSGTKDEYIWMRENQTLKVSLDSFITEVQSIPNDRPIYLTLDLDYFDPSFMPGTGTPEAGGETFHSFIKLMKILKEKNFVGADIVELSPPLDASGNSSVFATKVTRETILALNFKGANS